MAGKISKKDAGYGPGAPHCGACKHYIEEDEATDSEAGACKLVEGAISEDAVCRLVEPKRRNELAGGRSFTA